MSGQDQDQTTPHTHCWHSSSFQHAAPNHYDEVCCFCAKQRCMRLEMGPPPGHGPHTPRHVVLRMTELVFKPEIFQGELKVKVFDLNEKNGKEGLGE